MEAAIELKLAVARLRVRLLIQTKTLRLLVWRMARSTSLRSTLRWLGSI